MAACDKWVTLKVVEFLMCVACLVTKRISDDDSERLSLLFQKFSREWSLLRSVTWDSQGSSFADALYGGYVLITFGLLLGRIFQEIPRGRRIIEGFLLGIGMLMFLVIGGLELAALDSIPNNLIVNAAVLGTFSLVVAALFLIDLMGPRITTTTHHAQTDVPLTPQPVKAASAAKPVVANGYTNGHVNNGFLPNEKSKDTTDSEVKTDKPAKKDESVLFDRPKHGYIKFADDWEKEDLGKSKYGSYRSDRFDNGNYVRLSDPLAEPDRMHYERELARFNEKYFREYLDSIDGKPAIPVREDYLPEPQTPTFAKVKPGRLKSLYEDLSSPYEVRRSSRSPPKYRMGSTPTLHQLEEYLKGSQKARPRADTPSGVTALFPMEPIEEARDSLEGRASGTPTDPGYVQYAADRWPDSKSARTPRHSPTE